MTRTLWGPFSQVLPMSGLPEAGALGDEQLLLIEDGGIVCDEQGLITALGPYQSLSADKLERIDEPAVALPGFIDCHSHICYAGSRAADHARRLAGATYQEIAAAGGGILDTVKQTRAATEAELCQTLMQRCKRLREQGVTTCEVKSGYGLSVEAELKMLRAIKRVDSQQAVSLISTCLAAHKCPTEFSSNRAYLEHLVEALFPRLQNLTGRIDIFVEEGAFSVDEARDYLLAAKAQGFELTVHADQFSRGGCQVAAEVGALSADHLEASDPQDFALLKHAKVMPVALPGASLGLGMPQAPARAILDAGLPLAIASDWNPGSAPMGQLLTQAAILAAAQRLSHAETLAALSCRASAALALHDRGQLKVGMRADIAIFPCSDYREILYQQGSLQANCTLIQGKREEHHEHVEY